MAKWPPRRPDYGHERPPGQDYFGCRECYDLTYESAQTVHEFDTLYRHIADEMDAPFERVKDALQDGPPGL